MYYNCLYGRITSWITFEHCNYIFYLERALLGVVFHEQALVHAPIICFTFIPTLQMSNKILTISLINFKCYYKINNEPILHQRNAKYISHASKIILRENPEGCSLFSRDYQFEFYKFQGHWRLIWSLTSGLVGLVKMHAN